MISGLMVNELKHLLAYYNSEFNNSLLPTISYILVKETQK